MKGWGRALLAPTNRLLLRDFNSKFSIFPRKWVKNDDVKFCLNFFSSFSGCPQKLIWHYFRSRAENLAVPKKISCQRPFNRFLCGAIHHASETRSLLQLNTRALSCWKDYAMRWRFCRIRIKVLSICY